MTSSIPLGLAVAILAIATTSSAQPRQKLDFGNVKLGESKQLTVEFKSQTNNYDAPRSTLIGDGFTANVSRLLLRLDGYLWGEAEVTFTARFPGQHNGILRLDVMPYPVEVDLHAEVDTPAHPGVYANPPISTSDVELHYPPHFCYGELRQGTDTLTFSNSTHSEDSLRLWLEPQPKYFLVGLSQDTIAIAPGDSRSVIVQPDSNRPGSRGEVVRFGSNVSNYEKLEFGFTGRVEAFPSLKRDPELLTFNQGSNEYSVQLMNLGERVLTLDLPELQWPFDWKDSNRHIQLCRKEEIYRTIIVAEATGLDTLHTYWIRTNATNFPDSAMLRLKVSSVPQGVPAVAFDPFSIEDGRLVLHESRGQVEVSSIDGRLLASRTLNNEEQWDLRSIRQHLLIVRIDVGGVRYTRKVILE